MITSVINYIATFSLDLNVASYTNLSFPTLRHALCILQLNSPQIRNIIMISHYTTLVSRNPQIIQYGRPYCNLSMRSQTFAGRLSQYARLTQLYPGVTMMMRMMKLMMIPWPLEMMRLLPFLLLLCLHGLSTCVNTCTHTSLEVRFNQSCKLVFSFSDHMWSENETVCTCAL